MKNKGKKCLYCKDELTKENYVPVYGGYVRSYCRVCTNKRAKKKARELAKRMNEFKNW